MASNAMEIVLLRGVDDSKLVEVLSGYDSWETGSLEGRLRTPPAGSD